MPSLVDFYDPEGGDRNYLGEGWHDVTIKELKPFKYNSGSAGIEVHMEDISGKKAKCHFCLVPKALWKLANFAADCGMTQAMMRNIDPSKLATMNVFRGKRISVLVVKGEKYHEVAKWEPIAQIGSNVANAIREIGMDQAERETSLLDSVVNPGAEVPSVSFEESF